MISLAFVLMVVLFIIAGATQFWLLAFIGVGIMLATLLAYVLSMNDILSAIVVMVAAIAAPVLYLVFKQDWIIYVSYVVIGLWISSDRINDNDVYSVATIEGKVYTHLHFLWQEEATEFLIRLISFIVAALWGGLAFIGTKFNWFLIIPSLYLVVRSIIVLVKSSDYSLSHSFMLLDDFKDSVRLVKHGFKKIVDEARSSEKKISWWTLVVPIVLVAASVCLVYFENSHLYSDIVKSINFGDLMDRSEWFYFTVRFWNWWMPALEQLAEAIPFFGAILGLLLTIPCLAVALFLALLETFLSLLWLLVILACSLLNMGLWILLIYIFPALIPIGAIIMAVLSFTLNHAYLNRVWAILCALLCAIGCYYYFMYLLGITPIISLPM